MSIFDPTVQHVHSFMGEAAEFFFIPLDGINYKKSFMLCTVYVAVDLYNLFKPG